MSAVEPTEIRQRRGGSRGPERVGSANLRDVARLAGVSPATVSRVFGGNDRVNQESRARVLEAANQLGYVVNGLARAMMGRGRRTVAFVVQEMVGPTFAAMAAGVEGVASENGYLFLMSTTHGDPAREQELVDTLREQRAAAILLVGSASTDPAVEARIASYVRSLEAIDTRLVLCGRPPLRGFPQVPSIDYDHAGGVQAATRALIDLGHTSIAYIGQDVGMTTPERRLAGYRAGMHAAGLDESSQFIPAGDNTIAGGENAVNELLGSGRRPTALVCQTDIVAVGAYRALRKHGLRIPEDVSVVGFDDMPLADDLTPGLATVYAPFGEIGHHAARLALGIDQFDGPVLLPTKLVVRASMGAPPA